MTFEIPKVWKLKMVLMDNINAFDTTIIFMKINFGFLLAGNDCY